LLYSVIITRLEAEKYPLDLLALTTQPQE
jgi:hypothetical protein